MVLTHSHIKESLPKECFPNPLCSLGRTLNERVPRALLATIHSLMFALSLTLQHPTTCPLPTFVPDLPRGHIFSHHQGVSSIGHLSRPRRLHPNHTHNVSHVDSRKDPVGYGGAGVHQIFVSDIVSLKWKYPEVNKVKNSSDSHRYIVVICCKTSTSD